MVEEGKISEEQFREYWGKMKSLTIVILLLWTIPAFWLHLPVATTSKIYILGGIPLHWFNAAFVSVVFGIILIFAYAIVMDKWDREILGKG
ncbi:sodium/substrate symporter small subunit [Geoglobus acetivorans]|uniref:Sodium symporter small subunit domain-containing protein n=1 Tax=Geoglobus acetivorans TaxID=565033 RepID=A0A0A7GG27_GEOAI|nr:hypothetical protein GACE_1985 [Geoglobus acetivorans]